MNRALVGQISLWWPEQYVLHRSPTCGTFSFHWMFKAAAINLEFFKSFRHKGTKDLNLYTLHIHSKCICWRSLFDVLFLFVNFIWFQVFIFHDVLIYCTEVLQELVCVTWWLFSALLRLSPSIYFLALPEDPLHSWVKFWYLSRHSGDRKNDQIIKSSS